MKWDYYAGQNRAHAERFDGLRARAADLREKADSLLQLESQLKNSKTNLDNRELALAARERELRRREQRLERERNLQRDQEDAAEAHSNEQATALDTVLPSGPVFGAVCASDGVLHMTAEGIAFWGRVRRGEVAMPGAPMRPLAAAIVAAGEARRRRQSPGNGKFLFVRDGTLVADQPKSEAERAAAAIVAAGVRRRGGAV